MKSLGGIQQEEINLYDDLLNNRISTKEYFQRDEPIDNWYLNNGSIYDSLRGLQKKLFESLDDESIKDFSHHEAEHRTKAKLYGITSKFVYVESELEDEPVILVRTWFNNFHKVAKSWSSDKIISFLRSASKVDHPSPTDLAYSVSG